MNTRLPRGLVDRYEKASETASFLGIPLAELSKEDLIILTCHLAACYRDQMRLVNKEREDQEND